MTATTSLTEAALRQFTGSEHWYRHALVRDIGYPFKAGRFGVGRVLYGAKFN
jgi:hypothetical protein